MSIQPQETELLGRWVEIDGQVIGDATEQRIAHLIAHELKKVAASPEARGWEVLYLDQVDGRYWELSYPHSDWHGGGPRRLSAIPAAVASQKYGLTGNSN